MGKKCWISVLVWVFFKRNKKTCFALHANWVNYYISLNYMQVLKYWYSFFPCSFLAVCGKLLLSQGLLNLLLCVRKADGRYQPCFYAAADFEWVRWFNLVCWWSPEAQGRSSWNEKVVKSGNGDTQPWGSRWGSLVGHCPKSTEQGMACIDMEASLHAKLCCSPDGTRDLCRLAHVYRDVRSWQTQGHPHCVVLWI